MKISWHHNHKFIIASVPAVHHKEIHRLSNGNNITTFFQLKKISLIGSKVFHSLTKYDRNDTSLLLYFLLLFAFVRINILLYITNVHFPINYWNKYTQIS